MLLVCLCLYNGFKFAFTIGGLCEVECLSGKSCRKFGQFVCLCKQRKKGTGCKEDGMSSLFFFLSLRYLLYFIVVNSINLSKQLIDMYTVLVYTCLSVKVKTANQIYILVNVNFMGHSWMCCPVLCYALYYLD